MQSSVKVRQSNSLYIIICLPQWNNESVIETSFSLLAFRKQMKGNSRRDVGHVGLRLDGVAVRVGFLELVVLGGRRRVGPLALRPFIGRVPHWIDYVQQTTPKIVLRYGPNVQYRSAHQQLHMTDSRRIKHGMSYIVLIEH